MAMNMVSQWQWRQGLWVTVSYIFGLLSHESKLWTMILLLVLRRGLLNNSGGRAGGAIVFEKHILIRELQPPYLPYMQHLLNIHELQMFKWLLLVLYTMILHVYIHTCLTQLKNCQEDFHLLYNSMPNGINLPIPAGISFVIKLFGSIIWRASRKQTAYVMQCQVEIV